MTQSPDLSKDNQIQSLIKDKYLIGVIALHFTQFMHPQLFPVLTSMFREFMLH